MTKEIIGYSMAHLPIPKMKEEKIYFNGHECVDLGLPSGTLWATMNIGANELSETGSLFSWGGTDPTCCSGPLYCGGKHYFFWDSYELSSNGGTEPGTNQYKFNKYCPSGKSSNYYASGFSGDSLTQLLPIDDAATVNWGENWTLPTLLQILELADNTTLSSEYIDSLTILYTLTGPNGNSITFRNLGESWSPSTLSLAPCYFTYSMLVYLWSKDLDISNPYGAYILKLVSTGPQVKSEVRGVGISIRPVVKQN